ncbi:MAG: 5'-3' exonuclease [Candidatus Pristimantibacillus lignocellulolyticus]|uniref:5'-3' exonuclease n=1 Tax=Candidatus Pristimantibacillus lignocellulolyticus TaxID=2994561 RepID=A0A9J6Z9V3_9BACL|nr:MAG: 5'-3' exonuclease [Candidatus Pristimantibacillus lignocellulolyticus]
MPQKQKYLIIDGMAILFRAYFATSFTGKIRRTSQGVPVNGVHGFVRYFLDAIQTYEPTHVICCWDMGSKTFRSEQYSEYKGNRPSAPEDLIPQFDLVKEVVSSFDVPNIGIQGYEADDCIGTLAKTLGQENEVIIVTGDHDMLQLIDESVYVAIMKKGIGNYQLYTVNSLLEEKQLTPAQIIDVKGLMGDTADNYPGVKGIGEKTAHKLIQEFGSIDQLLLSLDKVSATISRKIEADLEMLHLSRQLATIHCEAPLEPLVEQQCVWCFDKQNVYNKFEELEFGSLAKLVDGVTLAVV